MCLVSPAFSTGQLSFLPYPTCLPAAASHSSVPIKTCPAKATSDLQVVNFNRNYLVLCSPALFIWQMLLVLTNVPGMILGAGDKVVDGTENRILAIVEVSSTLVVWGDRP